MAVDRGNRARRARRKKWLLSRARHRFLNPRIATYRPRSAAERWGSINRHTRSSVFGVGNAPLEVLLPPLLDFEDNYESTVSHFRHIRDAAAGRYRIKRLGFEAVQQISPAAALVLASEVDRWKLLSPRMRADIKSWNHDVKRLLCEMGYFELLDLPKPKVPYTPGELRFLNFLCGSLTSTDKGKLAQSLRINIEKIAGIGLLKKHVMFDSLSEAITNVVHHAYPIAGIFRNKPWWLSASFNSVTRELIVLIYDHGVGIPATLPSKWASFELIRDLFNRWQDSQKIEAAMTYGRTSTNLVERGKGLRNMHEFAKAHAQGRMSIFSRRGVYRMSHDAQRVLTTSTHEHELTIGGTLIEWSVRL